MCVESAWMSGFTTSLGLQGPRHWPLWAPGSSRRSPLPPVPCASAALRGAATGGSRPSGHPEPRRSTLESLVALTSPETPEGWGCEAAVSLFPGTVLTQCTNFRASKDIHGSSHLLEARVQGQGAAGGSPPQALREGRRLSQLLVAAVVAWLVAASLPHGLSPLGLESLSCLQRGRQSLGSGPTPNPGWSHLKSLSYTCEDPVSKQGHAFVGRGS